MYSSEVAQMMWCVILFHGIEPTSDFCCKSFNLRPFVQNHLETSCLPLKNIKNSFFKIAAAFKKATFFQIDLF
jgi:hypothetical protein